MPGSLAERHPAPLPRQPGPGDALPTVLQQPDENHRDLARARKLLKALRRSTAVIEFNLDGEVLDANDRFLQAMGYSLAQIKGKHHRLFCEPAEANSEAYQQFWARLRRGEFVVDRFKRLDAHGRDVWLEASYNPVIDAHDRLYKVVKFATVITDQVQQNRRCPRPPA